MTSTNIASSPTKRKMHPNSLKNLKPPYKKGENGHQGGYNLTERLRHQLDHPLVVPGENAPTGERLVYATLKGAIDLVPTPFREAWDRAEGKVADTVRITDAEGKPLTPTFFFMMPDGTKLTAAEMAKKE